MSLQAYQSAARRAEDPRQLEYRLFGDVTRALMEAAATPEGDLQTRIAAIDWNRRLWSALASDCVSDANRLPDAVRANIISLSLWVNRHSSAIMRHEESFQDLIEVNRMMMQGLQSRPEAA